MPWAKKLLIIRVAAIINAYYPRSGSWERGLPLPSDGFDDVIEMEGRTASDLDIVETLFGGKNELHNNYQKVHAFLYQGGKIGRQRIRAVSPEFQKLRVCLRRP